MEWKLRRRDRRADRRAHSGGRKAEERRNVGDSSYEAGSATTCYRYEVFRRPDPVTRRVIDCPANPEIPTPTAAPFPALPDDAKVVLAAVLATSSGASLQNDVRAAFPEDFMTVETDVLGDELLAAVGVPGESECIVGVRGVDGAVDFAAFDRT